MSTLTVQQQQQQQQKPVIQSTIIQNRIPLVHVLTSRSENEDEKVKDEPFQFEKLIKLLLDSHSVNRFIFRISNNSPSLLQEHLVDRRIRLCHKLYRHFRNGYVRNINFQNKKYQ
jgi:hypothetical protein